MLNKAANRLARDQDLLLLVGFMDKIHYISDVKFGPRNQFESIAFAKSPGTRVHVHPGCPDGDS